MQSQNTLNRLSRRNWLRDVAITATGVAVLPALVTGCTDHRIPPTMGAEPLTNAELARAAQNLLNMDLFFADVHTYNVDYERFVHELLNSSVANPPSGFKTFLLSLITAIIVGIMGVVVAAAGFTPGVGPIIASTVGAAIAIVSLNIKTWALDEKTRPATLEAEFARFDESQLRMRKAMSDLLILMADATDNYKNLREGWKDVDFNDRKYTLRDLANSTFPTKAEGATAYVAMRTAATEQFKRYIWNVMIAKAGSLSYSPYWGIDVVDPNKIYHRTTPTYYGREVFYNNPNNQSENQSRYLRGWFSHGSQSYYFRVWILSFDGRELSLDAAKVLFKDDTPGNIINPDGLFNRDYVFKQFHQEKPDFRVWDPIDGSQHYYDLRKDLDWGPNDGYSDAMGFADLPDDFVFTGGEFPQLIKK